MFLIAGAEKTHSVHISSLLNDFDVWPYATNFTQSISQLCQKHSKDVDWFHQLMFKRFKRSNLAEAYEWFADTSSPRSANWTFLLSLMGLIARLGLRQWTNLFSCSQDYSIYSYKQFIFHISYIIYHISYIIYIAYSIYHIWHMTYDMSHIIYHIIYHILYIIYHISYIIYHIWYFTYHKLKMRYDIPYIIFHISYIIHDIWHMIYNI